MNNIVLVGAGGTGMSGLAMMLFDVGYKNIICINNVQTDLTDRLVRHGLKVIIGHGNYTVNIKDFVIYSDIQAIIDGPEITQSRIHQQSPTKKHIHICMTYNQFIAEISKRFTTIAIAGSNGKTSTTAMVMWTLASLGGYEPVGSDHRKSSGGTPEVNQSTTQDIDCHDPQILSSNSAGLAMTNKFALGIVGGLMPNFNQQGYAISSDTQIQSDIHHLFEHIFNQKHQLDYTLLKKHLFVIEACEYKDHFLMYDVDYALVTNIARDHTDYFTTWESYQTAFVRLIHKTRYHSILTPPALAALTGYDLPDISVSGVFSFDNTYLVGLYNASNAGMIRELINQVDVTSGKLQVIKDGNLSLNAGDLSLAAILQDFQGVGRRMEYLGQHGQSVIYSDYSHHAPAIEGNIQALKQQFPDKTICAIFQPHQAQRILAGRDDFTASLQYADTTIVYRLYTAREDFSVLQSQFPRLESINNFDELGTQFAQELGANYITSIDHLIHHINTISADIIVYFSAGDLDEEMRKYINQ